MDNREILLDLIACVTGDEKGEFLPLDDSYENLQSFYREEVNKKLRELGKTMDLSGYTFEPNSTFFICDGIIDMHPFSKKDIDILLETKVNPYTDRKFSENGLENLKKIKEYFRGKFSTWGGLLELLESLDENTMLGREDIDMLKNKIIAIENTKTLDQLCETVKFFDPKENNYLAYLNSPVLDGLYMWCTEGDANNSIATQILLDRVILNLFEAVKEGKINIVKLLLKDDDTTKDDIDYAALLASKYGQTKILKLLLENGADVHANDEESLRLASVKGHTETLRLVLTKSPFEIDNLNRALAMASEKGHIDVVKLLLENGANAQGRAGMALMAASRNGRTEVVRLLLENGAQIHDEDDETFQVAVERGYNEIVELLRAAINRQ